MQTKNNDRIMTAEYDALQTQIHPLEPFLPQGAKLLMLGSFPPDRRRWSMDFYYPNLQNDMWRIFGIVFFGDKDHFMEQGLKKFSKPRLVEFLNLKGIALGDTAREVIRGKGTASDKDLVVVEPTDIISLVKRIPQCVTIVTTGDKATRTLTALTGSDEPPMGGFVEFDLAGRRMKHYRMPSSSRAYPKPIVEKAAIYKQMFMELEFL